MVKCEKRDYGYEIQISGTANDVIGEIANLAAAFHVNVMKDDLCCCDEEGDGRYP